MIHETTHEIRHELMRGSLYAHINLLNVRFYVHGLLFYATNFGNTTLTLVLREGIMLIHIRKIKDGVIIRNIVHKSVIMACTLIEIKGRHPRH